MKEMQNSQQKTLVRKILEEKCLLYFVRFYGKLMSSEHRIYVLWGWKYNHRDLESDERVSRLSAHIPGNRDLMAHLSINGRSSS